MGASGAIQTTVSVDPVIGKPGQEYDLGENNIVTKVATESIPFGAWVSFTGEAGCELPDSASEVMNSEGGVALLDPTHASGTAYVLNDVVRVLRKGRCWVTAEETVVAGERAFVRFTVTGSQVQGAYRNDADTATAAHPASVHFYRGAATGAVAILEVNLPGSVGATS